jgi:hypothetical protein
MQHREQQLFIVRTVWNTNVLCGRVVENMNVYSVGTPVTTALMKCKEVIGKLNDRATLWVLAFEEADGTDKLLPIASYEGPVQEHNCSSTLPLTLTLDAGG